MEKEQFKLKETEEFIPLMQLLKLKQVAQTGGHAKIIIEEGNVLLNGVPEFQKRKKLRKGDKVTVDSIEIEIL